MPRRPTSRSPFRPSRARPREIASDQIFRTSPTGTPGPTGPQGDPGVDGSTSGFPFQYNTSTSEADPGSGKVALNGTATKILISETDRLSRSIAAFLATTDDPASAIKGHVLIRGDADPSVFALLEITGSITDNGGWEEIPCVLRAFGGSFANNDDCAVSFYRTGDKGDTGPEGPEGPEGPASWHHLSAEASATLTLGAEADVPGATITTPNDGVTRTWMVAAVFYFSVTTAPELLTGYLNIDGTNQGVTAIFQAPTATARVPCPQTWVVEVAPNKVMKLRAVKTLSGAATCGITNTTIRAVSGD